MTGGGKIAKAYVVPFFIQLAIIAGMIFCFMKIVSLGEMIMPVVEKSGEFTRPTSGRLFYTIVSFCMFILMAVCASYFSRTGHTYGPFYMGFLAGTFLWQSIGECVWHFGAYSEGVFVNFTRLESVEVIPLLMPIFLLIDYGFHRRFYNWGVQAVIRAFVCNWMGHYVTTGMESVWSKVFGGEIWSIVVSLSLGIAFAAGGLVYAFSGGHSEKNLLRASTATFIGVSVVVFGFIH